MTNRLAFFLALILIALLVLDYVQFDSANTLFLLRKLAALIEWMAFWR